MPTSSPPTTARRLVPPCAAAAYGAKTSTTTSDSPPDGIQPSSVRASRPAAGQRQRRGELRPAAQQQERQRQQHDSADPAGRPRLASAVPSEPRCLLDRDRDDRQPRRHQIDHLLPPPPLPPPSAATASRNRRRGALDPFRGAAWRAVRGALRAPRGAADAFRGAACATRGAACAAAASSARRTWRRRRSSSSAAEAVRAHLRDAPPAAAGAHRVPDRTAPRAPAARLLDRGEVAGDDRVQLTRDPAAFGGDAVAQARRRARRRRGRSLRRSARSPRAGPAPPSRRSPQAVSNDEQRDRVVQRHRHVALGEAEDDRQQQVEGDPDERPPARLGVGGDREQRRQPPLQRRHGHVGQHDAEPVDDEGDDRPHRDAAREAVPQRQRSGRRDRERQPHGPRLAAVDQQRLQHRPQQQAGAEGDLQPRAEQGAHPGDRSAQNPHAPTRAGESEGVPPPCPEAPPPRPPQAPCRAPPQAPLRRRAAPRLRRARAPSARLGPAQASRRSRADRLGAARTARRTSARASTRRIVAISNWAKEAPMQRRTPPPNGSQAYDGGASSPRKRDGRNSDGAGKTSAR